MIEEKTKQIIDVIRKDFGGGSVFSLGTDPQIVDKQRERLSSNLLELDWALSGGMVRGVTHEIYGMEGSGKTTIALQMIKQIQKKGGIVFFCDAEHSLNVEYAKELGIDINNLLISQPDYGEQGLDIVQCVAETGLVDLIVIDSVTGLVPKVDIDNDFTDANMGAHARLMSKMCRVLTPIISNKNIYLILINQIRQKLGVFFGSPEVTTGGNAIKFYAGMRMRVSATKVENEDDVRYLKIDLKKQKWGVPFRNIELRLILGRGFDIGYDRINYGLRVGIIQRSSSYYKLGSIGLGNGIKNAGKFLVTDEEAMKSYELAIRENKNNKTD